MRVLTVDDHASFRAAAREVVGATVGFTVAGEVNTGEDGVAAWLRLRPEITVMDVRLPDISGYEASRRITAIEPGALIVLVSASEDALQGDEAARCGAAAFVPKREFLPPLLESIWQVHGSHE